MVDALTCQHCGLALPADAPQGICPYCVLKLGSGVDALGATSLFPPSAPLPSADELDALFPQLEILGLIGRGGMGVVYKARQASLDRLVALKILPPVVGRDPTFAERFTREGRALAKLSHPNIVAVFDSGQAGGLYYFVMEFVDGVNLRQAIIADQISPTKALAIVPQICDALQYAHEEGVVHRDIKPENVMLDRKGRVKVADFGLAKLLGLATADITLTGTSQAMGTLHYMAPEQYEKPHTVDHRADIYSLGVVFYELLTGKLPLGRFQLPSEKVAIDARLDQVVLKTMEREPDLRYQYASEVKTEMETIQRERPPPQKQPRAMPHAQPFDAFPRAATPEHTRPPRSDAGRILIWLGLSALLCLPLICVAGAAFMSGVFGFGVGWLTLLVIVVGALVLLAAGAVLISMGLSTRQTQQENLAAIPPEKAPFAHRVDRERVERWVRAPAFALLILALLNIVPLALFALDVDTPAGILLAGLFLVVVPSVIAWGALSMQRLVRYDVAVFAAVLSLVPVHLTWPLGLVLGIWALVVLLRRETRAAFAGRDFLAPSLPTERSPGLVVAIVAAVGLLLVLPVVALLAAGFLYTFRAHPNHQAESVMTTQVTQDDTRSADDSLTIVWTGDQPELGPGAVRLLGPAATEAVTQALQKVHRDYRAVEEKHITRKLNAADHLDVTIAPFPKEITRLENQFWTEVDANVHDNAVRGQLRREIALGGLLMRFGRSPARFEIWKVGSWYHYRNDSSSEISEGPELPHWMRHLWKESLPEDKPEPQE